MTIGLALGGGGPVGIAWEIGVLAGLEEAGFDLGRLTSVVGTSAGSVVGTHLANGSDFTVLAAEQQTPAELPGLDEASDGETRPSTAPDMTRVMEIFTLIRGADPLTTEVMQRIGQMAIDAPTPPESTWIASFERLLDGMQWSDFDLRVTTVDCRDGVRRVFTAADNVDLVLAVAASCAVPGLFPPVTIGDRRYTDGGAWSVSNADVLADADIDTALFIGPIGLNEGVLSPALQREQAALVSRGVELDLVVPGPAFAERIGLNVMDSSLRGPACEIGLADGRAAAARLAG